MHRSAGCHLGARCGSAARCPAPLQPRHQQASYTHGTASLHILRVASYEGASTSDAVDLAGPKNAFAPGQEAETRRQLFNRISPVYDELNERLSFGQHKVWKRMAVRWTGAKAGDSALDVCCGSGDLAFELARAVGPSGKVVGLDFAADMLADASAREAQRGSSRQARVQWVQGDALDLPFGAGEFDAATIGYGLRNVADIPKALSELVRVVRPGGCVAVLDFNNSTEPLVDGAQAWLLDNLVVPAARSYGLEAEYAYLRPSIKRYPSGPELERLARGAGFSNATFYPIGFGLMGCLVARK